MIGRLNGRWPVTSACPIIVKSSHTVDALLNALIHHINAAIDTQQNPKPVQLLVKWSLERVSIYQPEKYE